MAEISTVRLNLVKKKDTKSVVWNYFGIKADENGVQIPGEESRTCHKTVLCKGGNTTNLFVHLRDGHPALYKEATRHKLNPRYKLPSRKHFSQQEIPQLYNLVKETMVSPKLTQQTCGLVGQLTHT